LGTECGRHLRAADGLFCANFYSKRGSFAPCESTWCGPCYQPSGRLDFPIKVQLDNDGDEIRDPSELTRFREGRAGDHLMTPFQCDLCHFRNVMWQNPVLCCGTDDTILDYIRRANLDAMWCRAKSTVSANLRSAKRIESTADRLGMPSMTPPMGPFPLEDTFGMKAAIAVLDRSLDKGNYAEHVQWGTFRKVRSTITNISPAGVSGLGDTIGVYERKHLWISNVVTYQFWFTHFITRVHYRAGEIRKPDKLVTIEVLHAIQAMLESEWRRASTWSTKKRLAEMGSWFIGAFCTGIRGEEVLLVELAGTANSSKHLRDDGEVGPYFVFVISGRTKGNQLQGNKFGVLCVSATEGTGLRPGLWVEGLVKVLREGGIRGGRLLFARKLLPSRLMEFENDFLSILEKIQERSELIEADIDVRNEYGIGRSLRRGVTAHARNMGMSDSLVNAVKRWRKETADGTGRLDMADVYTTLESLTPTILQYSRAL
jgi:hypothetical protein